MKSELTNTLLKDLDFIYAKLAELIDEREQNGFKSKREELISELELRISMILDILDTAYKLNELEVK